MDDLAGSFKLFQVNICLNADPDSSTTSKAKDLIVNRKVYCCVKL